MTQTESGNDATTVLSGTIASQNAQVVNQEFKNVDNTIFSDLLSKSAKFWTQYGTSGGCLILGGATAILAISATIASAPHWTPEDLITILSFAGVLIVLGAATGVLFRSIETRRSEERVQLYGMVKEAIVELHKADVKALTDAAENASPGTSPGEQPKVGP